MRRLLLLLGEWFTVLTRSIGFAVMCFISVFCSIYLFMYMGEAAACTTMCRVRCDTGIWYYLLETLITRSLREVVSLFGLHDQWPNLPCGEGSNDTYEPSGNLWLVYSYSCILFLIFYLSTFLFNLLPVFLLFRVSLLPCSFFVMLCRLRCDCC